MPKTCPSCKARFDIKKSELLEKAASLDYARDVRSDSSISQLSGDLALFVQLISQTFVAPGNNEIKSACSSLEMEPLPNKGEYRRDDGS